MTDRRRLALAVGVLAIVGVAVAVVGPSDFFLPEESRTVEESLLVTETTTDGAVAAGDTSATTTTTEAGTATTPTPAATTATETTATLTATSTDTIAVRTANTTTTAASGGDAEVLKRGLFVGIEGHRVTGSVALVRSDGALYLQFRDYRQTQGPDVFIYVTPADTPETSADVGNGTKVRIDGGADNGESTLEGTFVQRLPDDVTAAEVEGVSAWCERFSVPFGYANLE